MKKILLFGCVMCLVAFAGNAQNAGQKKVAPGQTDDIGPLTLNVIDERTARVGIDGHSVDMRRDATDPNTIHMIAPDGQEAAKIRASENQVQVTDPKTGKVLYYGQKNLDGSGKIHGELPNDQFFDLDVDQNDVVGGVASIIEGQYRKTFKGGPAGVELVISDAKNNRPLYKLQGNDDYSRVYDAKGNLIAEGDDDNMKVYNKRAFAEFERIMDDDDEEDDDED